MNTLTAEVCPSSCAMTEFEDDRSEMIDLMPAIDFEDTPATPMPMIRTAVERIIKDLSWCGLKRKMESTVREYLKTLMACTVGDRQRALIEAVVQHLEFDGNTTARLLANQLRAVQPVYRLTAPDGDDEI